MTLDIKDNNLNWLKCSLNELPLISCVNCSTCWGRQYYHINEQTKSIQLLEADTSEAWQQDKVDKFSYPFPAFRVKLERLNDFNEEEFIECMGREYFCRLGGAPVFLSDPIEMRCPKCGRNMQYVGELTDNNFDNSALLNGLDFYFGDMFLYYYYCDECRVIGVDMQSI